MRNNKNKKVIDKVIMGAVIGAGIGSVVGASIRRSKKQSQERQPPQKKHSLLGRLLRSLIPGKKKRVQDPENMRKIPTEKV